jgi:tetratricopeptide (TPR) repeat protein
VYSFTHAITQEVVYSTIVLDTRAALHGLIGRELERRAGGDVERQLDVLAYHFARGDDDGRRRRYVQAAGEAAQARYANRSAIEYYRNVLPLLAGADRGAVLVRLGRAQALLGRWDGAAASFTEAYDGACQRADVGAQGWAQTEQGELLRKQGRYDDAGAYFDAARAKLQAVEDDAGVAEVDHNAGTLAAQRGDTALAGERYRRSLAVRRKLGDRRGVARSLNGLGVVAEYEGRLVDASALYQEALDILAELGDRWGVSALTNNLGMILLLQDRPGEARPLFDRAVAIQREIGDPHMLANFSSNLGDAARESGDGDSARHYYHESLALARALDERWLITYLLEDIAMLAAQEGRPVRAVRLAASAAHLRKVIGAPIPPETAKKLDASLRAARGALTPAEREAAAAAGTSLSFESAIDEALADAPPAVEDRPSGL